MTAESDRTRQVSMSLVLASWLLVVAALALLLVGVRASQVAWLVATTVVALAALVPTTLGIARLGASRRSTEVSGAPDAGGDPSDPTTS